MEQALETRSAAGTGERGPLGSSEATGYPSDALHCHVCEENTTDFTCHICGEPVCEDCCVVPTYQNQLDYALCTVCEDGRHRQRMMDADREYALEKVAAAKKKAIADKRHATYWKPENVTKRRLAKIERKRAAAEQRLESMKTAMRIVANMFKGM
jgi:hypothetical protein